MAKQSSHVSELVRRLKQSDREAFEKLFKLEYDGLCNYACIIIKDESIAQDVVQESFIRIWDRRNNLNIESSWKAYIYRSVHNGCINYLKKRDFLTRQNEQLRKEITYHNQIALTHLDPEVIDKLISEELSDEIEEVISALPEQCRKIFLMSRYDQLDYNEIAERLNISVNTVKTQIKRALKNLREVID